MKRQPGPFFLVSCLLGSLLLLHLSLPILALFLHMDWRGAITALTAAGAQDAIRVSLATSSLATLVIALLGVPLAYVLARGSGPVQSLLMGLVILPLVIPPLVGGILLLLLFGPYGFIGHWLEAMGLMATGNLAGIVLAQIFVSGPFLVIAAISAFRSVDTQLEQAAAVLGDTQWQVFRRISLPLAWPGIAAGITLAWARSLGEFGATLIISYIPHSVPVYLWVQFQTDGLSGALPLALLLILLGGAAMGLAHIFSRLRQTTTDSGIQRFAPRNQARDGGS
jgi:molybdate/tungstate transport system permease protein